MLVWFSGVQHTQHNTTHNTQHTRTRKEHVHACVVQRLSTPGTRGLVRASLAIGVIDRLAEAGAIWPPLYKVYRVRTLQALAPVPPLQPSPSALWPSHMATCICSYGHLAGRQLDPAPTESALVYARSPHPRPTHPPSCIACTRATSLAHTSAPHPRAHARP